MALGLYIHIPYCIQKCHYCDFATLPEDTADGYSQYVDALKREIELRAPYVSEKKLQSLYFGGGTPSLLPAQAILALRDSLANAGFEFSTDSEITVEANPGTLSREKLDLYRAAGVNRLSIGAQTFQDDILKKLGREHNAHSTRETLRMVKESGFNITVDLMFGLPDQNNKTLKDDIHSVLSYDPDHISVYNLTIPQRHSLNLGRPTDDEQAAMFDVIEDTLSGAGIYRYEISNFSKPGLESKHNTIYWTGTSYWGIGMSSHSYFTHVGPFGTRFWNPRTLQKYYGQLNAVQNAQNSFLSQLPATQIEELRPHEFLTDFFHTRLRRVAGFSKSDFFSAYAGAETLWPKVQGRLDKLVSERLLVSTRADHFSLTQTGRALANRAFFEMTFLAEDIL